MFTTSDVEQLINRQNFNIIKAEILFLDGMTISFIVAEKHLNIKHFARRDILSTLEDFNLGLNITETVFWPRWREVPRY